MYGEIHMLVGIAFQKAGPLEWAIPASIMSHFALDDLNCGAESIYHALGEGWRKWLMIAFRAVVWALLIFAYLWHHPVHLICGLISWLCFDWEWIVSPLFKRHGFGLHERMFPAWLRSRWGLLVNALGIVVMLGLVVFS